MNEIETTCGDCGAKCCAETTTMNTWFGYQYRVAIIYCPECGKVVSHSTTLLGNTLGKKCGDQRILITV